MNAELLLAHFNRVSDAPDAVAHLRKFILDLAVRGKLVEQDTRNEPTSELLKKIRREQAHLLKQGKIRRRDSQPAIKEEDYPFQLPPGWEWVRLIDVLVKLTDGTHHSPSNSAQGDFMYITAKNIKAEGVLLEGLTYISSEVHHEIYSRCNPEPGDILYIKDGATTGIVTINNLNEPFSMLSSVALLKPSAEVYNRLIVEFLRSPFFYSQMRELMKGAAITRVTLKRMAPALIPLPPHAEQHRIVAKIDELMALCDGLERTQREQEARQNQLTASTHHHLNNGGDAEALRSHAQFFVGHLPRLTTRPNQIKQFRQTILNLAVRGKLVDQDSSDEPVLKLITKIHYEQDRLIKKGLIPKRKASKQDGTKSAHSKFPRSWASVELSSLCNITTSGSRGWAEYYADKGPRFIRAQNIRFGRLRLEHLAYVNPPNSSEGTRTKVSRGDLLNVITGAGVTNPALLEQDLGEAYVSQHVALIKPTDTGLSPWLLLFLMAEAGGRAELVERAYGAGKPGLNLDNIRSLSTPVPPLAEQRRIVAQVDELMALCDQLEASLTTAQTEASRLLESVLHNALDSAFVPDYAVSEI